MKIVIFGLSISSAWGNGHATLWRGLCRELINRGHNIVFFERDVDYYRKHRDYTQMPGGELILYNWWQDTAPTAAHHLAEADVGIVTSYCPDGLDATDLVLTSSARLHVFYDLDTPVTLARVAAGETLSYVGPGGYSGFDLVLSYTGGRALDDLKARLGARQAEPLYGSVDPEVHRPSPPVDEFLADFSYLGTYAIDRQAPLEQFFLEPAKRLIDRKFLIGGSQYPQDFPWLPNVFHREHVTPPEHSAFYCSSPLTLNITRKAMADSGWCPSGRLFEASACKCAVISDWWEGLDYFYTPGQDVFICRTTEDVIRTMQLPEVRIREVAENARKRTLERHTAAHRAAEMESLLESALRRKHASSRNNSEVPVCGV
jgi:spore maturation protein CgeB